MKINPTIQTSAQMSNLGKQSFNKLRIDGDVKPILNRSCRSILNGAEARLEKLARNGVDITISTVDGSTGEPDREIMIRAEGALGEVQQKVDLSKDRATQLLARVRKEDTYLRRNGGEGKWNSLLKAGRLANSSSLSSGLFLNSIKSLVKEISPKQVTQKPKFELVA